MTNSHGTGAATRRIRPSREANARQLELAQEEGEAYQRSLRYMVDAVADAGSDRVVGQYRVGWAVEKAEGLWHFERGALEWEEPAGDTNCHLEISVSDAVDGRFVPYLEVRATVVGGDGREIGPVDVPFVWHPGLYHYGRNLHVPEDGTYTLRVHIAPPHFERHDHENGNRYADPVDVEFRNVQITTGRS